MAETLIDYFTKFFTNLNFSKELIIFILSGFPILEVRGGMIAAGLFHLDPVTSFIICLIGNLLPIPFLIFLLKPIFKWLRRFKFFEKFIGFLERKAEKNKSKIEKYQFWGLLILVGIPLPGTGAWTGCLVASVFDVDKKISIPACMLGVLLASIIMWIISFGVIEKII